MAALPALGNFDGDVLDEDCGRPEEHSAMEDMMREANESAEDNRWSALSLIAGFTIFLAVSGWL